MPARLVKRDPETQVILRRERVMSRRWNKLNLDSYTEVVLDLFLVEGAQETVLVVPKRRKGANKLVQELRKLQADGFAEQD